MKACASNKFKLLMAFCFVILFFGCAKNEGDDREYDFSDPNNPPDWFAPMEYKENSPRTAPVCPQADPPKTPSPSRQPHPPAVCAALTQSKPWSATQVPRQVVGFPRIPQSVTVAVDIVRDSRIDVIEKEVVLPRCGRKICSRIRGIIKFQLWVYGFEVLGFSEWPVSIIQRCPLYDRNGFFGLSRQQTHGFDEAHAADFDEKVDGVVRFAVGEVLRHFTTFAVSRSKEVRHGVPQATNP